MLFYKCKIYSFDNELCYMGWYVLNLKFSPFVTGLRTVQVFLPLTSLPLEDVNVAGNPLCNTENYTEALRALLPSLPASWGSPRIPACALSNFWCSTWSEDRTDDKGQNKCDTSLIYGPVFCVQLCLYLSFIYSYINACMSKKNVCLKKKGREKKYQIVFTKLCVFKVQETYDYNIWSTMFKVLLFLIWTPMMW